MNTGALVWRPISERCTGPARGGGKSYLFFRIDRWFEKWGLGGQESKSEGERGGNIDCGLFYFPTIDIVTGLMYKSSTRPNCFEIVIYGH